MIGIGSVLFLVSPPLFIGLVKLHTPVFPHPPDTATAETGSGAVSINSRMVPSLITSPLPTRIVPLFHVIQKGLKEKKYTECAKLL